MKRRPTKALVSFGIGSEEWAEMLRIAWPSFEAFAAKHGYVLITPLEVGDERPPSWMKVPVLDQALQEFDEVLWIDADAVIIDDSEDIDVPPQYWQALVAHNTGQGEVPGGGFWLLRKPMRAVLERIWAHIEHLHHGWWEQRALIDEMGYEGPFFCPVHDTELYRHTYFLDHGWSVHCHDVSPSDHPRVMQATMYPDRIAVMREWAASRKPIPSGITS